MIVQFCRPFFLVQFFEQRNSDCVRFLFCLDIKFKKIATSYYRIIEFVRHLPLASIWLPFNFLKTGFGPCHPWLMFRKKKLKLLTWRTFVFGTLFFRSLRCVIVNYQKCWPRSRGHLLRKKGMKRSFTMFWIGLLISVVTKNWLQTEIWRFSFFQLSQNNEFITWYFSSRTFSEIDAFWLGLIVNHWICLTSLQT